jgi:hypothetical protein
MNSHVTRSRLAVAVVLGALAGAGVALARTAPPAPAASASTLYSHLLLPRELPGFASPICPRVERDASRWALGYLSVDRLRRNGFVAGLREELHSASLNADALSVVALYKSTDGAQAELLDELAAARRGPAGFTTFPVAGIPGARGFALTGGGSQGYNVAFTDGPYLHLAGVGFAAGAASHPSKAQLIAAAAALYRRVHPQRTAAR